MLLPGTAVAALLGSALLSGCDDAGGLESAGPTPTAVGPVRLWPDMPPVTAPPYDYGESDSAQVPGVRVPGGDVHRVDPVAVVQAEVAAHPEEYSGPDGMYAETATAIRECARSPRRCPVMAPYYRDLTGDGEDELIVGIRMPEQQTGLRVYMPEKGGLTRIMSTVDQVVGVQLAGRDLVVRVVSAGIPGYEYRTAWSWDGRQRTLLPTRDEIVRVKPAPPEPSPSPPSASPSPSPSPSGGA
ncbi:hypothetical protein EIZ62_10210 [Streptomyces ficellus]|uniref:Lipoprotein n=1 Tax=Streptomyces ficellus TaxID=1977088 RepID=A0A6I6FSD1_9ACTN|nr:hypothetical protein EIZ62_10210 [Streptomyces ficellus]